MIRQPVSDTPDRAGAPTRSPGTDAPRTPHLLGLPEGVSNRQVARLAQKLSRDAKPITVSIMRPPSPPPPPEAMRRATPENRRMAEIIDTLDQLDDAALRKVREAAAVAAASSAGADQPAQELKLEAAEFLAQRRRIAPLRLESEGSATARRLHVRTLIEEGLSDPKLRRQTGGSFKKALASFTHTREIAPDIEFFERQAETFGREFTRQARLTALRLLNGSLKAMAQVLSSYGIPAATAMRAAERVHDRAWSLGDAADRVIAVAAGSKGVNAPAQVAHRRDLASQVRNLRNQQLLVAGAQKKANEAVNDAPISGEGAAWDRVKEAQVRLAHERAELRRYWIEAEREHPIIAAFRRGEDIEKVDLASLGTEPVQEDMKAVILKILPKVVDIVRVQHLIELGPENHGISPLALAPVVALTKTNMFVPDGSLRAGVVKDLVDDAAETEPGWVKVAAIALAIVTLIPSAGASLAVPIGLASAALATYSATSAWREYDVHKSLSDTDLDLARSLSTVEPALTGFAVSLVSLGIEAIPLVHAFNTARKIKALMNEGKNVERLVAELDHLGETSPARVKGLGQEARAEAEAANLEARSAPLHLPDSPTEVQAVLRPPPRDPELPPSMAGIAHTDPKQLQDEFAEALKQHLHGTADPNPDMAWVLERIAQAPDTSTNWQLMKVLGSRYATIRDPDKAAQFAAFLYRRAAERRITVRRALQEYVSGATSPHTVTSLGKADLLKDAPFVDLGFTPRDPHGRFTHMFQEGLIDFVHGPGEGRRLRQLIARSTGPGAGRRPEAEFWQTVWDAFYDDETGRHINRPEVLGPLLERFLGLPL